MIVLQLQKIGSNGIQLHFLVKDETIRGKGRLWKYRCKNIYNHYIYIMSQVFPDITDDAIFIYGSDKLSDNLAPCINVTNMCIYNNIYRDTLYNEYVNALKEYSKHSGIPIIVSEFKNLERTVN